MLAELLMRFLAAFAGLYVLRVLVLIGLGLVIDWQDRRHG